MLCLHVVSRKKKDEMCTCTLQSAQNAGQDLFVHQPDLSQFLFLQQQPHQPVSQESAGSRHHAHISSQGHRRLIIPR